MNGPTVQDEIDDGRNMLGNIKPRLADPNGHVCAYDGSIAGSADSKKIL